MIDQPTAPTFSSMWAAVSPPVMAAVTSGWERTQLIAVCATVRPWASAICRKISKVRRAASLRSCSRSPARRAAYRVPSRRRLSGGIHAGEQAHAQGTVGHDPKALVALRPATSHALVPG